MEALAHHQAVAEAQDHDERLHDRSTGRLDAEEWADMAAVPGRLGHADIVGVPGRDLARPALYLDVEGGPPLPIMRRGAVAAVPGLAGREIVEAAFGMKSCESCFQVLVVLGHEVMSREFGELGVHGNLR